MVDFDLEARNILECCLLHSEFHNCTWIVSKENHIYLNIYNNLLITISRFLSAMFAGMCRAKNIYLYILWYIENVASLVLAFVEHQNPYPMSVNKDRVKLRQRKMKSGKISLYLDLTIDGKREYRYLKLYLVDKPKSPEDREENKRKMTLAETFRSKCQVEIQNKEFGLNSFIRQDIDFLTFFLDQASKRSPTAGTLVNWKSTHRHLKDYAGDRIPISKIDRSFVEGFKAHLSRAKKADGSPLSPSTQNSYFVQLSACIRQAMVDKLIKDNPLLGVKAPVVPESRRTYLDLDEIRALYKEPCDYPMIKKSFLFSCLTGLRWSDIHKMKWSEVQTHEGGTRIVFKQKKTQGQEYLDINHQAVALIGDRQASEEKVFPGLAYSNWMNNKLQIWVLKAKITKKVTFHTARHSFAVMMLGTGTEIFTLSKLLGHREIQTTQIYAKVVDKVKQDAIAKIPDIGI